MPLFTFIELVYTTILVHSNFRLHYCEIVGKRGRTVPVIFREEIDHSLNLLCDDTFRQESEIHKENTYIFARGRLVCLFSVIIIRILVI